MENNKNYMKGFVPYASCSGYPQPLRRLHRFGADCDLHGLERGCVPDLHHAGLFPGRRRHGADPGQARRRDRPQKDAARAPWALYTVGQALIAICPQNVPLLLVFRFMVGIGAAGIAPVVMSYIMMEFPPEKMGQGFTVYMAAGLRHGHLWTHRRRHHHEGHRNGQCMAHRHVGLRRAVRDHVPDLLCKGQG
ncbi:MAG: hypothetical protein ACLUNO_12590 [Oscillospiraceae bacterium]